MVGSPIAHSRSPEVHALFAKQLGLPIEYLRLEPAADDFEGLVGDFFAAGGSGLNVTLPYKRRALELAAEQSRGAQLAAAANTLKPLADGKLSAINTDGAGMLIDITDRHGRDLAAASVCVLGAGGACAGVMQALLQARPASVVIANRTASRAQELVGRFASLAAELEVALRACPLADAADHGPYALLVNATAAAHGTKPLALDARLLAGCGFCYDMGYGAQAGRLGELAGAAGIPWADGLGMLVEQAALSFSFWEGSKPATEPVLRALATKEGQPR